MRGLNQAKKKIQESKNIVIASHMNPDGDSIGSLLSLGLGLEKLGKNIYMVCQDKIPKRYNFLPGAGRIKKAVHKKCDLAIAVDCGSKEILGRSFNIIKKAASILAIDHHEFHRPFSDLKLIDPDASAVGEIIYKLLRALNIEIKSDIAVNILTSIIVETNSFKVPAVRPFTFEVCAKLVKKNIDFYNLVDKVYWSVTKESALLSGICLARCKFLMGGRIVWSIIRKKDFNVARGRDEDVDAVASQMRTIKNVRIAILFREKDKKGLRVSLRSKGKINVASLAKNFGGGGHFDIAGCYIPNSSVSVEIFLKMARGLL